MSKNFQDIKVRRAILERIDFALQQIEQWHETRSYDYAIKYTGEAEGLIQLLEIDDCGSSGGYDPRDPRRDRHTKLSTRYKWLVTLTNKMEAEAKPPKLPEHWNRLLGASKVVAMSVMDIYEGESEGQFEYMAVVPDSAIQNLRRAIGNVGASEGVS